MDWRYFFLIEMNIKIVVSLIRLECWILIERSFKKCVVVIISIYFEMFCYIFFLFWCDVIYSNLFWFVI